MIQWKQSVFLWNGYLLIPNPSDGFIGPVREGLRQFFLRSPSFRLSTP